MSFAAQPVIIRHNPVDRHRRRLRPNDRIASPVRIRMESESQAMARIKSALPPAESVRALIDAQGRASVRVTPAASSDSAEIGADADGSPQLQIRVTAPPDKGKANKAVCKLIAKTLGIAQSHVEIAGGETSRLKLVMVRL